MSALNSDLFVSVDRNGMTATNSSSWTKGTCRNCGPSSFLIIATTQQNGVGTFAMLRCLTCRHGVVVNNGRWSPQGSVLGQVTGLDAGVAAAWEEVRTTLGAGCFTSTVMMCRKILFHAAVTHGLPEKDSKDRAPSFAAAVAHLQSEGLITPVMRGWVDSIKDVGNQANHDLAGISEASALRIAKFTEQLLKLTYEMPAEMNAMLTPTAESPDEGSIDGEIAL